MFNQLTQFTVQAILNASTDDTVSPPLITFGMMVWDASLSPPAWVRFTV